MVKKKHIPKRNSLTTAKVNRDVLGDLYRLTMKSGQVIDFKEALKYPLTPIPLSLSFTDSTKRIPVKSSLMKIIDFTQVVEDNAYANVGVYVVDLMATIWAGDSFLTEEELINQVLSIIPRDCGRVDLVADSYREISWKNSTRAARGEGSFTIVKLAKAKIQDTKAFLHESENKCQLIELFFDWLIDTRRKRLISLRKTTLYLFAEGYCQQLSIWDVSSIGSLVSTWRGRC